MVDPEVLSTYLGFFFKKKIDLLFGGHLFCCLFGSDNRNDQKSGNRPAKGSSKHIVTGKLDHRIPISVETEFWEITKIAILGRKCF